eukprot:783478-Amphidinium_carterae.4
MQTRTQMIIESIMRKRAWQRQAEWELMSAEYQRKAHQLAWTVNSSEEHFWVCALCGLKKGNKALKNELLVRPCRRPDSGVELPDLLQLRLRPDTMVRV